MSDNSTQQQIQHQRQALQTIGLALLIGTLVTQVGCSTSGAKRLSSMNPFAKSEPTTRSVNETIEEKPGFTQTIAAGTKNSVKKTQATFASWFGGNKTEQPIKTGDETDPTSLAHNATVTPEVFLANGRLWESTGNFDKAMQSYVKALEHRPNDPAALSNIARLHFRKKEHSKAAEFFQRAIQQKPDDAGLHNDLGLTYSKLGQNSLAVSSLSRALEISPTSSRYANNLASVKFEANDIQGAMEVLLKNNKPAVAHFNMAYLHYRNKQLTQATQHLNQAIAFKSVATPDKATKLAIDRSSELLAQITGSTGMAPGTAIAQTNTTAPDKATTAKTANQPVVKDPAAAGTAPSYAAIPASTPTSPSSSTAPGTVIPGFENLVAPASSSIKTNVHFGAASFRTEADGNGVNQTSAEMNPTESKTAEPASETQDAPSEPKTEATGFVFPEGAITP